MRFYPITSLGAVAAALTLSSCGDSPAPSTAPPATPASQRLEATGDRIVVRGDFGPDEFGPLELRGRYRVSFRQKGTGVDFGAEVPFTAHLEQSRGDRAPRRIELFERAAARGSRTITARGRWTLLVDFGDSPFEVVLARAASGSADDENA